MADEKSVHLNDDWVSLLLFIAPLVLCHSFCKKRNVVKATSDDDDDDDSFYLQKAHQLRVCLDKPRQSRFRVVALLVLNDGTVIPGTNDEPSATISGALCAERAAFLQLRLVLLEKRRMQQQQQQREQKQEQDQLYVESVYIVTDASIPVPPGMLCREYMYGHDAVRPNHTRVILQSADVTCQPLILTLRVLFPFPPIYLRLNVEEIAKKGQALSSSLAANVALTAGDDASQRIANIVTHAVSSNCDTRHMMILAEIKDNNVVPRLLAAARKALELDNRDMVHPLRFGAAAAVLRRKHNTNDSVGSDADDGIVEIVHASQRKAAEYGASLDAVCQLASLFPDVTNNSNNDDTVLMIVQIDQYGILHPPFGIARSFLVENGHGDCICLFMRERVLGKAHDDNVKRIPSPDADTQAMLMPCQMELVAVPAKELAPFPPEFR